VQHQLSGSKLRELWRDRGVERIRGRRGGGRGMRVGGGRRVGWDEGAPVFVQIHLQSVSSSAECYVPRMAQSNGVTA